MDNHLRHPRRRLELNSRRAFNTAQRVSDFLSFLIKLVKIVAEDIDDEPARVTGERLVNALGEKAVRREGRARKFCQNTADVLLCGRRLRSINGLETHLNLARLSPRNVIAKLGPSHALSHGTYARNAQKSLSDAITQSQGFINRGAGNRRHVHGQVPLLQTWQKGALQERQNSHSDKNHDGDGRNREPRRFFNSYQHLPVPVP